MREHSKLVIDILSCCLLNLCSILHYSAAVAVLRELVSVCFQAVMNVLGPDIHAKSVGRIHLVQFDSEGVFGWIPTERELISQLLSGDLT